jgi:phosphatidylglycerol lysyltransferase
VSNTKQQFKNIFLGVKTLSTIFDLSKQKIQTQKLISEVLFKESHDVAFEIVSKHGSESLDYFKTTPDKSIFIYKDTLISYAICDADLIVLGDPVGPKKQIKLAITKFQTFCLEHGWRLSFFQCSTKYLDKFKVLGFEKIKIGSEAIVDIENFNLDGPKKKDFRNRLRKIEKLGYSIKVYSDDVDDTTFEKLKIVSDEWLDEPNRIERGFSLGYFSRQYLNESKIMTVENDQGSIVAFINLIYSCKEDQITIDLMRKCKDAPSGVMDYIFVKAILELKERGFKSLSLGLAPMSGFQENEKVSFTESAVHTIFKRLNFLFNYEGLKVFKDKFATSWEPKYLVYQNLPQLPMLALSIKKLLERVD